MLQSNINSYGGSVNNWDTSYARKFLRIPEEQLKMINSIPEWAPCRITNTAEHPQKVYLDKGVQFKNMGNTPTSQASNYMEKEKLNTQKLLERNIQSWEATKSDLQLQEKDKRLITGKSALSRSASLCILSQSDELTDQFKLRSSNSAPHIYQCYKNLEAIDDGKLCVNEIVEVPQDAPTNRTDLIYTTIEIKENLQIQKDNDKRTSKIVKSDLKLGEQVLTHRFFKKSANTAVRNFASEKLSPIIKNLDKNNHDPVLSKRLMLLEKRFSPSKEICSLPSEDRGQKLLDTTSSSSENKEHFPVKDDMFISPQAVSDKSLKHVMNSVEVQNITPNMQTAIVKLDYSIIPCVSQTSKDEKDLTYEGTYGSQPIPCGQPLPTVKGPLPQSNSLNEANIKTKVLTNNSQEKILKKIYTDVIPGNHVERIKEQYATSSNTQRVVSKRKRKSKDDVHKKLPHSKNSRKVNIHFTNDQIKNMLDIMKMFQLDN